MTFTSCGPRDEDRDAAADMRDVLDVVGRELDRYLAVFRIQSAQSVFDSQNISLRRSGRTVSSSPNG